ncbi:MAG: SigE family RNA polymerase sigma factor [Actinomycetales bacterium]
MRLARTVSVRVSPAAVDGGQRGTRVDVSEDFEAFVVACSPALLRLAYSLTHDHGVAEDLLQVALVKVWGAWRRIAGDPLPYARQVLVNSYVSAWRRRWRHELPAGEGLQSAADKAAVFPSDDDRVGDREQVWHALGQLPRRQRTVLMLRYLEDLSEQETAQLLGISVGTVKSQASKALARLRVDPTFAPDALTSREA